MRMVDGELKKMSSGYKAAANPTPVLLPREAIG
jgi:hypothetical protein